MGVTVREQAPPLPTILSCPGRPLRQREATLRDPLTPHLCPGNLHDSSYFGQVWGTEVQRWDNCPAPHSEPEGSLWRSRVRTPSPKEQAFRGGFLRAPAFPPSSTYESPFLSHRLNLNKSSSSWPHPPAAAPLPRGPAAPTAQAGQGGGPVWLPVGEACTQ